MMMQKVIINWSDKKSLTVHRWGISTRHRILERTNEGRTEAKAKEIKFGRKRSIDRKKIRDLFEEEIGATIIAKETGIGRSTVYKVLNEQQNCQRQT